MHTQPQQRANWLEYQARFQAQIAKMDADLKEWAEKKGGADTLEGPDKKHYIGRQNGLIALANLDDATTEYITFLEALVVELDTENTRLRSELRNATGEAPRQFISRRDWLHGVVTANPSRSPQPLAVFCNWKSSARNASINYAHQSQPQLF